MIRASGSTRTVNWWKTWWRPAGSLGTRSPGTSASPSDRVRAFARRERHVDVRQIHLRFARKRRIRFQRQRALHVVEARAQSELAFAERNERRDAEGKSHLRFRRSRRRVFERTRLLAESDFDAEVSGDGGRGRTPDAGPGAHGAAALPGASHGEVLRSPLGLPPLVGRRAGVGYEPSQALVAEPAGRG